MITNDNTDKIARQKLRVTIDNDHGGVCLIVTENVALAIIEKKLRTVENISNKSVKMLGTLLASVECSNWDAKSAHFVIVENGPRPMIEQDLLETLGILIKKQHATNRWRNCINTSNSIKQQIAERFLWQISRIVGAKNHTVKSHFHKNYNSLLQKKRKDLLNIQDRAKKELHTPLDQEHNEKLDSCSDISFISPIVIMIKKDS